MRHLTTIIILLAFNLCSAQFHLDKMIAELRQSDFGKIYQVKDSIVNSGRVVMPGLIELLKDTTFAKLKNTDDLIYPGAEQFYGHGWIVNYDIDWISVRAAWLIEKITFQDFGYRDMTITEDKLMNLHKRDYTAYLQTGSHTIDFRNKTPRQQLILYRLMLADSVSKWWDKNKSTWTRFKALKDALSSNNEERQSDALHYLNFDETMCDGLTLESFKKQLKPLVQKIKNRKSGESDQAKQLLEDNEYYWLKIKSKKSGR